VTDGELGSDRVHHSPLTSHHPPPTTHHPYTQGALEALIALGEETRDAHPELDVHMVQVCSL